MSEFLLSSRRSATFWFFAGIIAVWLMNGCTCTTVETPSRLVEEHIEGVKKDLKDGKLVDTGRLLSSFGEPQQIVPDDTGNTAYWVYDDTATTEKGWSFLFVFTCSSKSQNSGRLVAEVAKPTGLVQSIWPGTTSFLQIPK